MENLAERLRELRESKKLSMKDFGKAIGVSDCAVSNWENCINEPKASYLKSIGKTFGVSVDYLLGLEENTDSEFSGLNENEQKLLKAFVLLNKEEQEKLITDAEFYSKRNK